MPPKTSNAIDRAWAEAFAIAVGKKDRTPTGPGWKTRAELEQDWNAGTARVNRAIRAQIKSGALEVFRGFQWGPNNKPHPQRWYRPSALRLKHDSTGAPTGSSARPRR